MNLIQPLHIKLGRICCGFQASFKFYLFILTVEGFSSHLARVCGSVFFSRVGSHHWETISSAHSVLPGFQLAARLFWESLASWLKLTLAKIKHKPLCYAPKSAFSFEVAGSKFIHRQESKYTIKVGCCIPLSNKFTTHQHVKKAISTQALAWMCPNQGVTQSQLNVISKSWSNAIFSGNRRSV